MDLVNKQCVPCKGGVPGIPKDKVQEYLKQTPGWVLTPEGKAIHKAYTFKNFRNALEFVNKVGEVAEQEKHHPDITLGWGKVVLTLQTHSINALHENDFILAAKINGIES